MAFVRGSSLLLFLLSVFSSLSSIVQGQSLDDLAAFRGSGNVPGGGGINGMEKINAKKCPAFQCENVLDEEPVPVWPLQINATGGCGSSLGSLMSILPGAEQNYKAPELDKCCNIRHACLQVCGINKKHCDDAFLKCTDDVCDDTPDARLYRQCHKTLENHRLVVKTDHCDRYTKEQADHCTCVPVEDAAATRREILTQFYRLYKPKDLAKVDALADWAADSAPKMAQVLQQLVAKYHRARKSVVKPAASAEGTTTSAEETTEETTTTTTEEQPSTTGDEL